MNKPYHNSSIASTSAPNYNPNLHLPSLIFFLQSSFFDLPTLIFLSLIFDLPSSMFLLQSSISIFDLLSLIFCLWSPSLMFCLLSSVFDLQFSIFHLPSSVFYLPCSIFRFLSSVFNFYHLCSIFCLWSCVDDLSSSNKTTII